MTLHEATAPPRLLLPSYPLDNAAIAIERARAALFRAQNLEWVSVAADDYRAELGNLNSGLSRLAQAVDTCQREWAHARMVARVWGQL